MSKTEAKDHEKMPLIEHLSELRKRLIISLLALLAGFVLAFSASEKILDFLMLPMRKLVVFSLSYPFINLAEKPGAPLKLVFLAPAEAFWMHFKIAFVAGLVLVLPVILHQLWRFIAPGLLEQEKKYVAPFVIVSSGLFLLGAAFCFVIVLPFAMNFLLGYKTESLTPMISVGNYIDFCLKFILAFAAIFELPLVIVFLTRLGVVTPQTLARNRKYAVLLAFVAAAILTPTPDAFNQTLMAVPMILLFEGGILASRLLGGRKND